MCMHIEKRLENMSVYSDSGMMSEIFFFFYMFLSLQFSKVISLASFKKPHIIEKLIDIFDTIGSNIPYESYTFWILLAMSCKMT